MTRGAARRALRSRPMSRRSRFAHVLACLALALALAACSRAKPSPNVVVVVLDTARPDWLSTYGAKEPTSPFLDELAREGTTFERAYSTSSWTLPAHASLFTGTLPSVHHAVQAHPKLDEGVPTLAERLAAAGYATAGFSNNPWVAEHTGLARGFARFVDEWPKRDLRAADPSTHPTVRAVDAWLAKERDASRPFFLFVNLIEPHMPYLPPPAMAAPFFADASAAAEAADRAFTRGRPHAVLDRHYGGKEPLAEDELAVLANLYRGELRYVDAVAGAIVRAAQASGGADTLVFVVSDHGENLGDHGHLGHTFNLYDSNVRIVLVASGPGIAANERVRRLAQIQDVFATAVAAAGLARDERCVGSDLRKTLSATRNLYAELDRPTLSLKVFGEDVRGSGALARFDRSLEAVIGPRYKLIRGSDGTEEVYDLVADPDERASLALDEESTRFAAQAHAVLEAVHAAGSATPGAELTRDPRVLEALESLGYVQ